MMIRDPSLLDWLRWAAERRDREALVFDLWADLAGVIDEDEQRLVLRRFRQRETLRIGYNDIVRGLPLDLTTARPVGAGRRLRRGRLPARPREG